MGALEAESGLNDAPTVVLVTLISTGALAEHGVFATAGIVVYELAWAWRRAWSSASAACG